MLEAYFDGTMKIRWICSWTSSYAASMDSMRSCCCHTVWYCSMKARVSSREMQLPPHLWQRVLARTVVITGFRHCLDRRRRPCSLFDRQTWWPCVSRRSSREISLRIRCFMHARSRRKLQLRSSFSTTAKSWSPIRSVFEALKVNVPRQLHKIHNIKLERRLRCWNWSRWEWKLICGRVLRRRGTAK